MIHEVIHAIRPSSSDGVKLGSKGVATLATEAEAVLRNGDLLLFEQLSLKDVPGTGIDCAKAWKKKYYGCSPICDAITGGHNDLCSLLLDLPNANVMRFCENHAGKHSLFDVVEYCDVKTLKKFASKVPERLDLYKNSEGDTLLHAAARWNKDRIAKYLLSECKLPVDSVNYKGETALYQAARENSLAVIPILIEHKAEVCKPIIDRPGHRDSSITTALHIATFCGHVETARLLVAAGGDVNQLDSEGQTALHDALLNGVLIETYPRHGDPEMIQFLLAAGADTKIEDCRGRTPYQDADREILIRFINFLMSYKKP